MLEKYYKYKIKYDDYILLIKIGNFYEMFDIDSLIINKLFDYKLKPIKDTFKCGFPINSLDNVINKLNYENINYVIIDDEIIKDKRYENNNYKNYNFNINILKYNYFRINKIIRYLNDNMMVDLSNKLDKIEDIINNNDKKV